MAPLSTMGDPCQASMALGVVLYMSAKRVNAVWDASCRRECAPQSDEHQVVQKSGLHTGRGSLATVPDGADPGGICYWLSSRPYVWLD